MSHTIAPVLGEATIQELRESLQGEIVLPGDDVYAEASHVWNGVHDDRRPALIARCAAATDVIAAVGFARSHGLTVAVRGGGHSVAGFSTCDGGIVIDLRRSTTCRSTLRSVARASVAARCGRTSTARRSRTGS